MLASEVAEADEAYVALQQVCNGYGYVRVRAYCVERAHAHTHTRTQFPHQAGPSTVVGAVLLQS